MFNRLKNRLNALGGEIYQSNLVKADGDDSPTKCGSACKKNEERLRTGGDVKGPCPSAKALNALPATVVGKMWFDNDCGNNQNVRTNTRTHTHTLSLSLSLSLSLPLLSLSLSLSLRRQNVMVHFRVQPGHAHGLHGEMILRPQ